MNTPSRKNNKLMQTPSQVLEQCTKFNDPNAFDPTGFSLMADTKPAMDLFSTSPSTSQHEASASHLWDVRPIQMAGVAQNADYSLICNPALFNYRRSESHHTADSLPSGTANEEMVQNVSFDSIQHRASLPMLHHVADAFLSRKRRHTEGSISVSREGSTEDDEEKRKNFLERNRQAALKCRQRKKQWLANLQHRVEHLTSDNEHLQQQATMLREEILNLKTLLLAHKDCPVAQANGVVGLDTLCTPPPPSHIMYQYVSSTVPISTGSDSPSSRFVPKD
ncbi:hypothetical protein DFQ30_008794 [Apophysomyces sp. BC1015]|nr:hypothetical protein DFQ30_008794 [Apophysomyces sp. BC1015]